MRWWSHGVEMSAAATRWPCRERPRLTCRLLARPEWPPRVRSRGLRGARGRPACACRRLPRQQAACRRLSALAMWMASSAPTCTGFTLRAAATMPSRNDRGRGEHALQHQAAIDHRVGPLLTGARHGARQLDFRDDAGRELPPRQELALDSGGLCLAYEQLEQRGGVDVKDGRGRRGRFSGGHARRRAARHAPQAAPVYRRQ
jgi:hypothetical protein